MPTVLITGANRGIGLELARQYVADKWSVIATCREPGSAKELRGIKGDIRVEAMDVADEGQIKSLAKALSGTAIDVLLNNAGILPGYEAFGQTDTQTWLKTLHVNVIGPLHIAEAFADHVARSQQKKIASITSGMGSIGNNSAGTAYVYRTSKAGLNMAMVTAANHLRAQDIIVAVISPGWVKTDMGGANATLTVSDSASGIRKVIAGLTPKTSGRFFNHSGEELPW
jgi:NAD(P)-dependent dehydrogenase (short-subunit alcohol dehydrogenase family)